MVGGFLNRDFGVLTLLRASLKNAILKIVRNTAVGALALTLVLQPHGISKQDLKKASSHKLVLPRDFEVALHFPTLALTENRFSSPCCFCSLRLTRSQILGFRRRDSSLPDDSIIWNDNDLSVLETATRCSAYEGVLELPPACYLDSS